MKDNKPRRFKTWSKDEDTYLLEQVSKNVSVDYIARKLGRTSTGVYTRMYKLGVANRKDNIGMYTVNEISKLICIDNKTIIKWGKLGLKLYKKKVGGKRITFINGDDFWKFAENHKDLIVFKRIEKNSLLPEPVWVEVARKTEEHEIKHKKKWTKEEDEKLIKLSKMQVSYSEIAKIMKRNYSSITHRLSRLNKANKKINIRWKPIEVEIMYKLEKQGKTDSEIAEELGREIYHIRDKRKRLKRSNEYRGYKISKRAI